MWLSQELSVKPNGELALGYGLYTGRVIDPASGELPCVPQCGFSICGVCEIDIFFCCGELEYDTTWMAE